MSTKIAEALVKAPFNVGKKQVYLPNFSIVLHRRSHLGPKHATFTVPLWFSKLDLRDYLFHAYDVRILSARSYIQQSKVQEGKPSYVKEDYEGPQIKRWHRPRSIKRMTVELETPFVWPDEPEDREPWQESYSKGYSEADKENAERYGRLADAKVDKAQRKAMREQAQAILRGEQARASPETRDKAFISVLQKNPSPSA